MSELPQADSADTDAVQMALQAAHTLWSRGDTTESLRWLKRAAESASDEGADLRSLQLAKAAAELRAKLFPTSSDSPPAPARVPTQRDLNTRDLNTRDLNTRDLNTRDLNTGDLNTRDLTGVRPAADVLAGEAESLAAVGMTGGSDFKALARLEDSPPSSRAPSSAPQYVVHRPREPQQQRQLMGLSSSTLETARQHNGPSYSNIPSWSASSERRTSSPPPLPHRTSIDDYEELEAEPEEESDAHVATAAWANTAAPTWRPQERTAAQLDAARREGDSSPRVATLPPPSFQPASSSSPPPLPELSAFGDEDGDPMRPEQPTVVIPPQEEQGGNVAQMGDALSPANGSNGEGAWDSDPRMSNWDSGAYGWSGDPRASGWPSSSGAVEPAPTESTPPKLTARVHHQAVRVSFAPDSRAPGQYVVRPLREGERPLAGERVALLVALEPGVPLV
ncbi:MAG: hypothetical protein ABI895_05130 [Deltaproteobacteria bacterium]